MKSAWEEIKEAGARRLALLSALAGACHGMAFVFGGTSLALGEGLGRVAEFFLVCFSAGLWAFFGLGLVKGRGGAGLAFGFKACFASLLASFGALALPEALSRFGFPVFLGASIGFLWISRHAYELGKVDGSKRASYAAAVAGFSQLAMIGFPAFLGALTWLLAGRWGFTDQSLGPMALALSILCVGGLRESFKLENHKEASWDWMDWRDSMGFFRKTSEGRAMSCYWALDGFCASARICAYPLAAAIALGGLSKLGGMESLSALLANVLMFATVSFWRKGNGLRLLAPSCAAMGILWFWAGAQTEFLPLMALGLGRYFLQPAADIASHALSQGAVEKTRIALGQESRMPALCARECWLFIGRLAGLGLAMIAAALWVGTPRGLAQGMCWAGALSLVLVAVWGRLAFGPQRALSG